MLYLSLATWLPTIQGLKNTHTHNTFCSHMCKITLYIFSIRIFSSRHTHTHIQRTPNPYNNIWGAHRSDNSIGYHHSQIERWHSANCMSVRVCVYLCEMQIKAVEVSLYHCFDSNIGVALFGLIALNDTIQRARKHEIEWILSIASRTTTTATATITTTATSATTTTISEVL